MLKPNSKSKVVVGKDVIFLVGYGRQVVLPFSVVRRVVSILPEVADLDDVAEAFAKVTGRGKFAFRRYGGNLLRAVEIVCPEVKVATGAKGKLYLVKGEGKVDEPSSAGEDFSAKEMKFVYEVFRSLGMLFGIDVPNAKNRIEMKNVVLEVSKKLLERFGVF